MKSITATALSYKRKKGRGKRQKKMKKARQRRAFLRPSGAVSCRILPSAKQAGQALRRAPHQIPYKSPALPDFYSSARAAPRRRGLVRCADERGLSPPVSPEPGAYLRGTASPLEGESARLSPAARSYHGRRARENAGGIRSDPPVLRCWRPRGSCPCPFPLQLGR